MTTIFETKLLCPCCNLKFEGTGLGSTNTFGPQSTDFRKRAMGFDPLYVVIQTCPNCGFSGYEDNFNQGLDNAAKEMVLTKLQPIVQAEEELRPDQQYEFAALVAQWADYSNTDIADRYLRAAWCASDAGLNALEKQHRNNALKYFKSALQKGEVEATQVPVITYLIGELYRRIGQEEIADHWFNRAIELTEYQPDHSWLVVLSKRQKMRPTEYFDHTMIRKNDWGVQHLQGIWRSEKGAIYSIQGTTMMCKDPGSPDFQQWQDKERLVEIQKTDSGFIAKQAQRNKDGHLQEWIDAELFLVDDNSLMLYLEDEHPIKKQIIPFHFMFYRQLNQAKSDIV